MSTFIENQNWRYATKKYDAGRKISDEQLAFLKDAVQLSVSSTGLQPYKVIIVENDEMKQRLLPAAYNQTPITDASHIFVFAGISGIGESHVDQYMNIVANTREIDVANLEGFRSMVNGAIASKSAEARNEWTARQCYIALGNLLAAAAELHLDATPMEGFIPDAVDEALGLKELGVHAAVIAAVGFRHIDDKTQHNKKVRKPQDQLFVTL